MIPHHKHWPRYSDRDRQLIVDYLSAYLLHAENATARTREMQQLDPEYPGIANQVNYWLDATRCIRWLIYHAGTRQRHLWMETMLAEREGQP